jgi:hypothetical protein
MIYWTFLLLQPMFYPNFAEKFIMIDYEIERSYEVTA